MSPSDRWSDLSEAFISLHLLRSTFSPLQHSQVLECDWHALIASDNGQILKFLSSINSALTSCLPFLELLMFVVSLKINSNTHQSSSVSLPPLGLGNFIFSFSNYLGTPNMSFRFSLVPCWFHASIAARRRRPFREVLFWSIPVWSGCCHRDRFQVWTRFAYKLLAAKTKQVCAIFRHPRDD